MTFFTDHFSKYHMVVILGYIPAHSDFPFYPDDDYYPVNPVLPSEDGIRRDSTTIVACAASVVVAALMAVFLIVEYRKR